MGIRGSGSRVLGLEFSNDLVTDLPKVVADPPNELVTNLPFVADLS